MDEEGSVGSQDDTGKLKEEDVSLKEAINKGKAKADDISVLSQE